MDDAISRKFEIWLELLLKNLGYQNVMRNVEYRKNDGSKREVDICYDVVKNGSIYSCLVEAKYTRRDCFGLGRNPHKSKMSQEISIENIVDEVWERHLFVGADFSFIATNSRFSHGAEELIRKKRIKVIDGERLSAMYNSLGYSNSIENSIKSIDLGRHHDKRSIIYV